MAILIQEVRWWNGLEEDCGWEVGWGREGEEVVGNGLLW